MRVFFGYRWFHIFKMCTTILYLIASGLTISTARFQKFAHTSQSSLAVVLDHLYDLTLC